MRVLKTVLLILVAGFVPLLAHAQEKGQLGLDIATPTAIGFIWHVSDRVAVRPEFSFSTSSFEIDSPIGTTESDSSAFSVGVSGLFYLRRWDNLSAYVTPRLLYTRTKTESTLSVLTADSALIGSGLSIAGSFGTQYSLGKRFGVFGEVGVSYSEQDTSGRSFSESASHSWSTRTALGVILYF